MEELWQRIEAWLRLQAPPLYAALASGASPEALRRAEARLQVRLPDAVRASYALHDGSGFGSLFPFPLLSLQRVVQEWNNWRDLLQRGTFADAESTPQGPIQTDWWNLRWIPFTHDGGGNHQCLDLDPAPGGQTGQVINFDHEVGATEVLAPSFRAFLAEFADELEAGCYAPWQDGQGLDRIA
jgi:cell wall assembly regulator SMI1